MRSARLPSVIALALVLVLPALRAAQAPAPAAAPAPPLPFITEHALGGLKFDNPVAIVTPPGETNRIFIVEKSGRIIVIPDLAKPERVTFLDITREVGQSDNELGLLALAFHPDYKNNRQFYLWFTLNTTTAAGTGRHERLARFTASATNPNQADPASEQPLISQFDRAPNHNGGQIMFGPEGYLYFSIGDEGGGNDQYHNSQLIDHNFFSGLHRLDVDQRPGNLKPNPHPSVHDGTYLVPKDNPFVGVTTFNTLPVDPAKVRTEFWAVGLRNPWRFSFDSATGLLWVGDVGQDSIEEVDIIKRGGNYGWNYREADQPFFLLPQRGRGARGAVPPPAPAPTTPPAPVRIPPDGVKFEEPVFTYFHPAPVAPPDDPNTGNSITGGLVYRGKTLTALTGRYLFADYVSGWIWALSPTDGKGGKVTVEKIARRSGIVSFGVDPRTGEVLMSKLDTGYIEKLVPAPARP